MAIEALHLKPADVARALDESPSKLGNWMRGDNYPDAYFVYRFWDRYRVTADWLYLGVASGLGKALGDALYTAGKAEAAEGS